MQASTLHLSPADLAALVERASGKPLPEGMAITVQGERVVLSIADSGSFLLPKPLVLEFHGATRRDRVWEVLWAARGLGFLQNLALKAAWPLIEGRVRANPALSRLVVGLDPERLMLDLEALPVGEARLGEIATVTELRIPGAEGAVVSAQFVLVR